MNGDDETVPKIWAAVCLFIISMAGTISPFFIKVRGSNNTMHYVKGFVGGILLSAGLVHLLPNAMATFADIYPHIQYPFIPVIAMGTFLVFLGIEHVMLRGMKIDWRRRG